jgi:hypothetical protein
MACFLIRFYGIVSSQYQPLVGLKTLVGNVASILLDSLVKLVGSS